MAGDHTCQFITEQQSTHRFCSMCGRHDPPDPRCPDRPSALWVFIAGDGLRNLRDRYARLAIAHQFEPTVPDRGGGLPGDLYDL